MTRPEGHEYAFARRLAALAGRDDGDARRDLAALRRGLGRAPGEVAEVARVVLGLMREDAEHPPISERAEAAHFLVAALFASHRGSWQRAEGERLTNLGASFARLRGNDENPGAERRLVALLNAHPDELDRHLRHAISLLKSKEIGIDWAQLLRDVQEWDHEDRRVQRDWARAFWGSGRTAEADAVPAPAEGAPAQTGAPTPA